MEMSRLQISSASQADTHSLSATAGIEPLQGAEPSSGHPLWE
jgi:hypothetical protein